MTPRCSLCPITWRPCFASPAICDRLKDEDFRVRYIAHVTESERATRQEIVPGLTSMPTEPGSFTAWVPGCCGGQSSS